MPSCQINITGTSGSVIVSYTQGLNKHKQLGYVGDSLYVDTLVTDVKYSTINGDAIAASGCITITNAPDAYYKISWRYECPSCNPVSKRFSKVIYGINEYPIDISYNVFQIGQAINDLDIELKAVYYYSESNPTENADHYLILKTNDVIKAELELINVHKSYLKAELIPVFTVLPQYIPFEQCVNYIPILP